MLVHATTIDIAGCGVLLLGEPGAGKSDLALRLIAEGALLVSDDQTCVEPVDDELRAFAPSTISGQIETRGIGVVRVAIKAATRLRLVVVLSANIPERMPQPSTWSLPGREHLRLPLVELSPFEASATAKLRQALAVVLNA